MGWTVPILLAVLLLLITESSEISNTSPECSPVQYIEIGRSGLVTCSFSENLLAISWFNVEEGRPLILHKGGVKSGEGYDSGEYDVYLNGSLFIKNVTVAHESLYRVTKAMPGTEEIVSYLIDVYTTVSPPRVIPVIDDCIQNYGYTCYQSARNHISIGCFVRDSRPAVNLTWIERTSSGDHSLQTNFITTTGNDVTYMSRATTTISFKESSVLILLVCKASNVPLDVVNVESTVVVENVINYTSFGKPLPVHTKLESPLHLFCADTKLNLLVWKRSVDRSEVFDTLLISTFQEINGTDEKYQEYELHDDGSLYVQRTSVEHDARYACLYDDGFNGGAVIYDVLTIVDPVPAFPLVEGCNNQQYCVLEKLNQDVLKCSVMGIRPEIQLEWRALREESPVAFTEQRLQVKQTGDMFDISLISSVHTEAAQHQVTVECRAVGSNANLFNLSTKFDLLFANGLLPPETSDKGPILLIMIIIITIVVVVTIFMTVICLLVLHRKRVSARLRKQSNAAHVDEKEEEVPMLQHTSYSEMKKLFIKQLKTKYQVLCDSLQPIPYLKGTNYSVDRMFVESDMELKTNSFDVQGQPLWNKLESYKDLFSKKLLNTKRQIIIGEPGYGKSTMTLQMVYDWCQSVSSSPLKRIDAVIYLRLRQLGGITSIYSAIGRFILPKDTEIKKKDIKNILSTMSNVLVILDGFDEYPDRERVDTDIYHILSKNMCQDFIVILTTRPSFISKDIESVTERIRLTGFGAMARKNYVRKVVKNNDEKTVDEIIEKLRTNPVADDFCEVPLFFVMFVHMTYENQHLMKFNSVTSFFRYTISCFHSHLKNKMKDENVHKIELRESNHKALDKLAFEAVSGQVKKIVWDSHRLRNELGDDFYEQYSRTGILVEEEVLEVGDTFQEGTHVGYKTEVRFFHKLFCEWYAAHHLPEMISDSNVDLINIFQGLDPSDLQYVYRFACGLNKFALTKIIRYLCRENDTEKLTILCMLEQEDRTGIYVTAVEDLLSSRALSISHEDSNLLQRSAIQILEFSTTNQINISSLFLDDCFKGTNESRSVIILSSGLQLSALATLYELYITQTGKEFSEEEMTDIFIYISKSDKLKTIKFTDCILPFAFRDKKYIEQLSEREVNVLWHPLMNWYHLNLKFGIWEAKIGSFILDEEHYNRKVDDFREMHCQ